MIPCLAAYCLSFVSLGLFVWRAHINSVFGNEFGWSCWSVNILKSNKEQDRAAYISLNTKGIQDQLAHSVEILHSGCASHEQVLYIVICNPTKSVHLGG